MLGGGVRRSAAEATEAAECGYNLVLMKPYELSSGNKVRLQSL